jgi:hypothetical protein
VSTFPGAPRQERSTGWQIFLGCAAGCLVLLIAAGVACGLLCRHVTARKPVDRATTVLTGDEIGYAWLYATESDPGMAAIGRHLERALERMGERAGGQGKARTRVDLSGPRTVLPVRLQLRAYPPVSGSGKALVIAEAELSRGHNAVSLFLRFMAREKREVAGQASVYHFPDEEGDFWLGVLGNRLVIGRDRARVAPLLDGSHAPAPARVPSEAERLLQAARLPHEDAGAWARGAVDPKVGWMQWGALSLNLVSEDQADFRVVFEVPEVPEEGRGAVTSEAEAWLRGRVPEDLALSLHPAEWIDPRTVRYAGTVTGIAAALQRGLESSDAESP